MRRMWVAIFCTGCAVRTDDLDRDGWSTFDDPPDCDDFDPGRHPWSDEIALDGVDQDCNGVDLVMRAVGGSHSCELEADGVVWCDGDNSRGQLDVPTGHVYIQIACGDFHSCALDAFGSVTCWGDNTYGQSLAPAGTDFIRIDADANWSLGVQIGGALRCWGACWEQAPSN